MFLLQEEMKQRKPAANCNASNIRRCAPLLHLFCCILQLLLLPLRHQIIQPAQFSLGEDEIQQLTNKYQRQDLEKQRDEDTRQAEMAQPQTQSQVTIMGKTMAALEVLMTHSRTKQLSWMMVKRWTFLSGTCRR